MAAMDVEIIQEDCCRTCLSHCKPFTSIYIMAEKIPDLTPTLDFLLIKPAEIDKSTIAVDPHLCNDCFEQIKNIHKFKEKCLESSRYLNEAKLIQLTKIESLIKEEIDEALSIKDELEDGFDQSVSEDDDDLPLKTKKPTKTKNKSGTKLKHPTDKIESNDDESNKIQPTSDDNVSLKSKTPPKRSTNKSGFCADCNKTLTNIKRHTKLVHESETTRKTCTYCSSTFTNIYALNSHIKKQHSITKEPTEHTDRERKTCEICGIAVFQIAMHKRNVHGGLKFDCEHCGKTFKGKHSLKLHIEYTHENPDLRPALCPHCGAAFRCNSELNKHFLQKHSDAKNYKCGYCERRFKTNSQCRLHERRAHLNIRKWKCSYCPNAFLLRRTLLNHIRTHTGERPFQCELCSKSFAQKPTLTTHVKLIHLKHKM